MKKYFPFTILLMVFAFSSKAYDFKVGDLCYYFLTDSTVEVFYENSSNDFSNNYLGLTTITIPESVTYNNKTYPVIRIGGASFNSCKGLTSITIPESVTSIGTDAFKGCDNLTIKCKTDSKPSGWNLDWNPDNRPVVWNATDIDTDSVSNLYIYAHHNMIVVKNATADIYIFDATGRCIDIEKSDLFVEIAIQRSGIYIVKVGNEVKRVAITM